MLSKTEHSVPLINKRGQLGLELLQQLSDDLWKQPDFDKLTARFIEIQFHYFSLIKATLFKIKSEALRPTVYHLEIDHALAAEFSDKERESIAASIGKIDFRNPEYRIGMHHYVCAEIDMCFAFMGSTEGESFVLVWQMDHALTKVQKDNYRVYIDFLLRQIQNGAAWIGQLTQTQALLIRDDLTGLYNARYLDVSIENEIRRAQRFNNNFCLLFIDLDNFKMINDKFGHLAGSSVLCQIASVLRESSREIDTLFRYGGDEFIILLLGASPATGLLAGERIRRRIENARFMLEDGVHVSLTASIGDNAYPQHAQSKEALLKLADETMYRGKRGGKNRVLLFDEAVLEKQDGR